MRDFLEKIRELRINFKYSLIEKLGEGGFGAVYLGKDSATEKQVALKLEHQSLDPSILEEEHDIYKVVDGLPGFPRVYWFGWHDDYRILAFERLGPSLEDLFEFCKSTFSVKTVVMIMQQLLSRFEALHSRGLVHRDVKPRNCLLGSGKNGNVVYLTDFGLAQNYSADDEEITDRQPRLVGTPRFASIRGHLGRGEYVSLYGLVHANDSIAQSPCDDLESLGYMAIYFVRGGLPWQGLKAKGEDDKHRQIVEMKSQTDVAKLCEGLPQGFAEYMKYVKSLRHGQTPNYEMLRGIFRTIAKQNSIEFDNVFDWTEILYFEQQANYT